MKSITFSAEAELIERAREVARSRHTSLNAEIRAWLEDVASGRWEPPGTTIETVNGMNDEEH